MSDNFNDEEREFFELFLLVSKLDVPSYSSSTQFGQIKDFYNKFVRLVVKEYNMERCTDCHCEHIKGDFVHYNTAVEGTHNNVHEISLAMLYPNIIARMLKDGDLKFNYPEFGDFFIKLVKYRKLFKPYKQYMSVKTFLNASYGMMHSDSSPLCLVNKDGIKAITDFNKKKILNKIKPYIFNYSTDTAYCRNLDDAEQVLNVLKEYNVDVFEHRVIPKCKINGNRLIVIK